MDYHLKPVGKACHATGKVLEPGAECYSALVEQEGQFVRFDFSEQGWAGPPEGAVGCWRCRIPQPAEHKPQPLDSETLMRYFEQLSEEPNPAQEKLRYVLSLLLLQKRRLSVESSRQDGEIESLELIGSQGEGPFEVRDQHLSADEIEQLQRDLNAHLSSEWT